MSGSLEQWAERTLPMLDDHEWRCILHELDDMGPALDVEQYDAILRALNRLRAQLSGNAAQYLLVLGAGPWDGICAFCGWTECAELGLVARIDGKATHTTLGRALVERHRQQSTDGGGS